MKTVLAPNAPWPVYEDQPKPKRKPRIQKPRQKKSKIDENFERWLASQPPIKK
jgi:hypothetical protein